MNNIAWQIMELQEQLHSEVSHLYRAVINELVERQEFGTNTEICGMVFGDLTSVNILSMTDSSVTYTVAHTCTHTGDHDTASFRVKDSWGDMSVAEIVDDILLDSTILDDHNHANYLSNLVRNIARLEERDRKYVFGQFLG